MAIERDHFFDQSCNGPDRERAGHNKYNSTLLARMLASLRLVIPTASLLAHEFETFLSNPTTVK